MSSFVVSKEDVKNFVDAPCVSDQEGIMFVYAAPEEVLKSILPPHLTLVAPVICGYVVQIKSPNFGAPYMESVVYTVAQHGDIVGGYSLNLMLHGPGAEQGVIVGRDCCGIPKKYADEMELRRMGDQCTAKIVRHGVTLMEIDLNLTGEYNAPVAAGMIGDPEPGDVGTTCSFFHKYNLTQTEKGNCEFSDLKMVTLDMANTTQTWDKGELSIKVASSPDDPYGELEVVQPLGAAWFKNSDCLMKKTTEICELDVDATMPYLMTGRYDRSMMGHKGTYLNI
ncbi:acetoacetate decarboxylase family protein [Enterococcus sp. 669A]|uniref:Acetoacetate decarboxylase family protein n=1 Tax=Candidatus Enterococcus moelleringii TaxID=2815325 RepID=A0ABS3L924_9ENTE|nr:acetoacetate decarboxylase family protein [Enterococcus sp. 669A]MBO1306107.1 acetoacetate decarboxylase family protein [Enterococcus sp. 669A]